MFAKIRKTAVVLAAGSLVAVTANAEAGQFRNALSQFKNSAQQFRQQASQNGGYRQTFKNALSQRMQQGGGQSSGQNPGQNGGLLSKARTLSFPIPDIDPGDIFGIPGGQIPGGPAPDTTAGRPCSRSVAMRLEVSGMALAR